MYFSLFVVKKQSLGTLIDMSLEPSTKGVLDIVSVVSSDESMGNRHARQKPGARTLHPKICSVSNSSHNIKLASRLSSEMNAKLSMQDTSALIIRAKMCAKAGNLSSLSSPLLRVPKHKNVSFLEDLKHKYVSQASKLGIKKSWLDMDHLGAR